MNKTKKSIITRKKIKNNATVTADGGKVVRKVSRNLFDLQEKKVRKAQKRKEKKKRTERNPN